MVLIVCGCASSETERVKGTAPELEQRHPIQVDALADKDESLKVSQELAALVREFEAHEARGNQEEFRPTSSVLQVRGGRVAVECSASGDSERLADDLEDLGLTGTASYGGMVGGWLPITAVPTLPELESLRFARAAMATTNSRYEREPVAGSRPEETA